MIAVLSAIQTCRIRLETFLEEQEIAVCLRIARRVKCAVPGYRRKTWWHKRRGRSGLVSDSQEDRYTSVLIKVSADKYELLGVSQMRVETKLGEKQAVQP